MQTRKGSAFEVCCNVLSGLVIANITWIVVVIPIAKATGWGFQETHTGPIWVVNCIFTAVSIVRSYFWRRLFNWLELKNYVR